MGSSRWGSDNAFLEVYFVVPEGSGAAFGQQRLVNYSNGGEPPSKLEASLRVPDSDSECPADSKGDNSSESVLQAEPVEGNPSSFRLLRGGKPVTVDVRQFVLEMPFKLSACRALGDSAPPRDAIDEAGET